jgi:hypothetical protein
MPFPALRSRPGTSASQRRRSLADHSPNKTAADLPHNRDGALERLSLHLTKPDGDNFDPLFTHEPEEMASRRQSAAQSRQSEEQDKKSCSTPAATSPTTIMEPKQPVKQDDQVTDDEPLLRPHRFSLLKFRHASDPQLSSRFKKTAVTPPLEPIPPLAPTIITTAPTAHDLDEPTMKNSVHKLFGRSTSPFRKTNSFRQSVFGGSAVHPNAPHTSHGIALSTPDLNYQRPATEGRQHPATRNQGFQPPAYGDESN